jgi:MGT family glycosyltransferase
MKKILIFGIPYHGHVNPLFPIVKKLSECTDIKIIVYLIDEFKEKFDSIGVEMRSYKNNFRVDSTENLLKSIDLDEFWFMFLKNILEVADENLEYLAKEIDQENPDLIVYDVTHMYFKALMCYYNNWYEKKLKTNPSNMKKLKFCPENRLPPIVAFVPSFMVDENIYPNRFEKSLIMPLSCKTIWNFIKTTIRIFRFSNKYGTKIKNFKPTLENHKFAVSSVLADLQPRSELFDKNMFKFAGATFDENKDEPLAKQEPFNSILNSFEMGNLDKKEKLIYISLGTVFNFALLVFQKIIDSLKLLEKDEKTYKYTFIVSVNKNIIDELKSFYEKKNISIGDNVHLVETAPQISILKRASLFVTHSGMNSTSESVHYGVPMVCIPMTADQPLIAYHIADELGLGIRLNYKIMNSEDIYKAMNKILIDKSYVERVLVYSKISRTNDGIKNACDLIINALNS